MLRQVDFDADDEGDDDDLMPTKALMKKGLDGEGMGKVDGLDGMPEKDKMSAMPLIIDGLEVDRDVSSCLYRILYIAIALIFFRRIVLTDSLPYHSQLFD